jgi:dTDP-4-amino-4,6-dideoxygalactose transaminase
MLTYQALDLDGDVVVPSFTFMATVSSMVWAGLRPVFADVDVGSTNLTAETAERVLTPRTRAIVATHNFGNPADISGLQELAQRYSLRLVFDAAHGFGALQDGVPLGRQGDAQVFSLSPTKLLIAGEGGIVATDDAALATRIRTGREYGNSGAYDSAFAGMNARMPELSAAMGLLSLARLEEAATHRNQIAALYRRRLGRLPGIGFQAISPSDRSSYKDFSITVDATLSPVTRDELAVGLSEQGIDTRKYYDPPVHRQTAYRHFAADANLPSTDRLASESLSLPIWSDMEEAVASRVCSAVEKVWGCGE